MTIHCLDLSPSLDHLGEDPVYRLYHCLSTTVYHVYHCLSRLSVPSISCTSAYVHAQAQIALQTLLKGQLLELVCRGEW
jgi:hypothetical protein